MNRYSSRTVVITAAELFKENYLNYDAGVHPEWNAGSYRPYMPWWGNRGSSDSLSKICKDLVGYSDVQILARLDTVVMRDGCGISPSRPFVVWDQRNKPILAFLFRSPDDAETFERAIRYIP